MRDVARMVFPAGEKGPGAGQAIILNIETLNRVYGNLTEMEDFRRHSAF